MNLRIEGQHLRFRISKEELEQLCQGTALVQRIALPGRRYWEITVSAGDGADDLNLTCEGQSVQLIANTESIRSLLASLPSREGIEVGQALENGDNLQLSLEVDIRTQKRRKE